MEKRIKLKVDWQGFNVFNCSDLHCAFSVCCCETAVGESCCLLSPSSSKPTTSTAWRGKQPAGNTGWIQRYLPSFSFMFMWSHICCSFDINQSLMESWVLVLRRQCLCLVVEKMCCLLLWIRFDQIMDSLATQIQRIDVFFQSSFAEDFVREHIFLSENRCFSQNCFILSSLFGVVKNASDCFLLEKMVFLFFSGFFSGTHHCNGKATHLEQQKKTKKDIYSQSSMAGYWSKGNMRPTEGLWLLGHLLNTSV